MGVKAELRGMTKGVYDPDNDGVIAAAQTEADMKKAVYDPDTDNEIAGAQIHDDLTHANLVDIPTRKFFPCTGYTTGVWLTFGYGSGIELNADAEIAKGTIVVPKDYVSDIKIYAVLYAPNTGDVIYDVDVQWSAHGEGYAENYDLHPNESFAAVAGKVYLEDMNVDFTTPTAGSTPVIDEILGVDFVQDTGVTIVVMGFLIEYTAEK